MKLPSHNDRALPVDGSADDVLAVYLAGKISRGSAIFLLIDVFGFSWDDAMAFLCDAKEG